MRRAKADERPYALALAQRVAILARRTNRVRRWCQACGRSFYAAASQGKRYDTPSCKEAVHLLTAGKHLRASS